MPQDWAWAMISRQAEDGSLYGNQWWIPDDPMPGEVMTKGIYGQRIYIKPAVGVVIAVNSADRGAMTGRWLRCGRLRWGFRGW